MDNSSEIVDEDDALGVTAKVKSSAKYLQAIELTALGKMSEHDIATITGVSVRTLSRWRDTQLFNDAVRDKGVIIFKGLVPAAIATLENLLTSTNQKVRLEAAKVIIDKTFPDLQQVDKRELAKVEITVKYE